MDPSREVTAGKQSTQSKAISYRPAQPSGIAMTAHKRSIHLTDDNWAEYLSDDYPTLRIVRRSSSPA